MFVLLTVPDSDRPDESASVAAHAVALAFHATVAGHAWPSSHKDPKPTFTFNAKGGLVPEREK